MSVIRIGEILQHQGLLSRAQIDHILDVQAVSHRPFGDLAERLFGISPKAVEEAWVGQFSSEVDHVDLARTTVDPTVRGVVDRRQAWQFHLLPLRREDTFGLVLVTHEAQLVRALNFATRTFTEHFSIVLTDRVPLLDKLMELYPVPKEMAEYAARK